MMTSSLKVATASLRNLKLNSHQKLILQHDACLPYMETADAAKILFCSMRRNAAILNLIQTCRGCLRCGVSTSDHFFF